MNTIFVRLSFSLLGIFMLVFLNGCFCKHVPTAQKLANCTNDTIKFQLVATNLPPYQFVLGMPQNMTNQLNFSGDIIIKQSTGTVARISINSRDITSCNWLSGMNGYILTWSRTNRSDRLEAFLIKG
jgi:hypothetical protein